MSLESGAYFLLPAHLNLDWLRFRSLWPDMARDYHVGQHSVRRPDDSPEQSKVVHFSFWSHTLKSSVSRLQMSVGSIRTISLSRIRVAPSVEDVGSSINSQLKNKDISFEWFSLTCVTRVDICYQHCSVVN